MAIKLQAIKNYARLAKGLLFVPRCAGCDEFLPLSSVKSPQGVLCPDCMFKWDEAMNATCRACGKVLSECECIPSQLHDEGCGLLISLVNYDKNAPRRSIVNKLIFEIKDRNYRALSEFLAFELSQSVGAMIKKIGADNCVLTYAPRSKKALNEKGHDQARELAIALSRFTGVEFVPCIRRVTLLKGERAQKSLNEEDRADNARHSFAIRKRSIKRFLGKCVILVDDVVTTGASLAACTSVLIDNGALTVACLTVASSMSVEQ